MTMDVVEIQKLLPHRYPFLFVDRVVEFDKDKRLVAFKNVTFNEQFFMGHFPERPVMPGVLILEALAQACAILAYKSAALDPSEWGVYLMSIDNAKFRKPVVPGDRLTLTAEVVRHKGPVWKIRGIASVDGKDAAEADFLATVVKNDAARPEQPEKKS